MSRRCSKCDLDKPDGDFIERSKQCAQCRRDYFIAWAAKNGRSAGGRPMLCGPIEAPIDPAVPAGFALRELSTLADAEGKTEKQWVTAKPESIANAEIRPSIPAGHLVKGVSTLVDSQGRVSVQWIKTATDRDREHDALIAAMSSVADRWDGKADPLPAPLYSNDDLMCVYPIGDPHFGALSWRAETGFDWTLKHADASLRSAIDRLAGLAPPAKTGLFLPLGDNSHTDNMFGTTTAGTRQDTDTRWAKVMDVLLGSFVYGIERGLEKHDEMIARVEIGNHDSHAAIMIAMFLAQFFRREPRVKVDTSPSKFWYHRFGKVLIGSTHTDTCKREDLPGIMACDRPEDWGATKHRYFYTGHLHHERAQEFRGCIVYTLRTLAARDKWHTDAGYRSGRDMRLHVIHRDYGLVRQDIVGIDQLPEIAV